MNVAFNTPFDAQIEFLRQKLNLPTERMDDIKGRAHDRAFMVTGAAKADLVADFHQLVNARAADGAGLESFRKDFKQIVAKNGWTGWTGEGTKAGEAWRTRVIYQTNMATSYAAGRYAQMSDPEVLKLHPYWRYIHSEGAMHPRPLHLSWHGLTLPAEHPFWKTHFAPNGYGCQCRITSVTRREGEASARAGLGEPPADWQAVNAKTGAPVGIDKGFDYAPGASVDLPLRQLVQDKLVTYPPAVAKALAADIGRYISTTEAASAFAARALSDSAVNNPLWLGFVERVEAVSQAAGRDVTGYLVTLPSDAPRHTLASHGHDG
ncbi:MAG: phage minor head protein, partial [Rhodoferax sp.]